MENLLIRLKGWCQASIWNPSRFKDPPQLLGVGGEREHAGCALPVTSSQDTPSPFSSLRESLKKPHRSGSSDICAQTVLYPQQVPGSQNELLKFGFLLPQLPWLPALRRGLGLCWGQAQQGSANGQGQGKPPFSLAQTLAQTLNSPQSPWRKWGELDFAPSNLFKL